MGICVTCGMLIETGITFTPDLIMDRNSVKIRIGDREQVVPLQCVDCKDKSRRRVKKFIIKSKRKSRIMI